jgi:ABC-type molybdate transport system substrate-binding protein
MDYAEEQRQHWNSASGHAWVGNSSLITRHLAAATIGALTVTVVHVSTRAPEVRVLSAVGMRQVMRDLGPKFERATGTS